MAAALGVGVGVVGGGSDAAAAGGTVEGRVTGGTALGGAEVGCSDGLSSTAEGDEVSVGGGGGAAAAGRAEAKGDGDVKGGVAVELIAVWGRGVANGGACTTMGVNTRYAVWFEVRKTLKEQSGN